MHRRDSELIIQRW